MMNGCQVEQGWVRWPAVTPGAPLLPDPRSTPARRSGLEQVGIARWVRADDERMSG